MADCGGLIRDLGLTIPRGFLAADRGDITDHPLSLIEPFSKLLSALPDSIHAHVFVDHATIDDAGLWFDRLSVNCTVSLRPLGPDDAAIDSPWIQDRIHVRTCRSQDLEWTEILGPEGDHLAQTVAPLLGADSISSDLVLPGGNQLIGGGFRLVGSAETGRHTLGPQDSFALTARWRAIVTLDDRDVRLFGYRPDDVTQTPWRPADLMPASSIKAPSSHGTLKPGARPHDRVYQCGFHVDQFVSVTGLLFDDRPLLLVADPIAPDAVLPHSGLMLKRQLDACVLHLEDQGFAIERNPIPLAIAPDSGKRLPRLYNNVLLENAVRPDRDAPLVFVPQFGDREDLQAFDELNLALWRGFGFDPVPVTGWSLLASRNGALRCATKVFRRDPFADSQYHAKVP